MLPYLININLIDGPGFNKRASCVHLDLWGAHGHRWRVETGSNQSGQMRPKARFEPARQVNSLMLGWFTSSKEVYECIGLETFFMT
jgi:hypothetical protein